MSSPPRSRMPTFNHVAMSVPAELLEDPARGEILRFYAEVFGWSEMPGLGEAGKLLVLRAYSNEQFVFLSAGDEPMRCGERDHFGLSVGTLGELRGFYERAREFRRRDPRVEIVEPSVEDYRVLKLHSFYVRYRLPLMVEVQCYEWAEGVDAGSLPG